MHPCPGNCVAIGLAVVCYAWATHVFSAGTKCRHCMCSCVCVGMYVCMYVFINVFMYVCMYVCVCIYACMHG